MDSRWSQRRGYTDQQEGAAEKNGDDQGTSGVHWNLPLIADTAFLVQAAANGKLFFTPAGDGSRKALAKSVPVKRTAGIGGA
jgi:hypothetical protein